MGVCFDYRYAAYKALFNLYEKVVQQCCDLRKKRMVSVGNGCLDHPDHCFV